MFPFAKQFICANYIVDNYFFPWPRTAVHFLIEIGNYVLHLIAFIFKFKSQKRKKPVKIFPNEILCTIHVYSEKSFWHMSWNEYLIHDYGMNSIPITFWNSRHLIYETVTHVTSNSLGLICVNAMCNKWMTLTTDRGSESSTIHFIQCNWVMFGVKIEHF